MTVVPPDTRDDERCDCPPSWKHEPDCPLVAGVNQEASLSREGERRYESWLESLKDHGP